MDSEEFKRIYDQVSDGRRKKRGNGKGGYQARSLWQRHHEILNRALLGESNKDIAHALGVTEVTVSSCLNGELGKQKLEMMRMERDANAIDVKKEIDKMIPDAIRIYREILRDKTGTIPMALRKNTADTVIMDIGGHAAPKQVQGIFAHLSAEEIESIKLRGHEEIKRLKGVEDGNQS